MSTETFGKYQLIKRLATGGMAQIYLARKSGPEGFQKQLVVKRILPHLAENEEFVRMFLYEAKIAARLNHPNVVQISDFGSEEDSYFIAMEYIHGEDVRRVWKRADSMGQVIPLPLVCRIVIDACAGLHHAHTTADERGQPLNIVHRDVSPQNILVSFDGGVKVVDFGIAKAADQATVTRSGVLKGKYSYMSPEQAAGKRVDKRTDIFALGIVLYELLTVTRLFKRSNDVQTLQAVSECRVAPPSEVDGRIPRDLDTIVMKALAKNADDRYQEASDLQMDLENWLIQKQMQGATAHLRAFMQDLYADRLRREKEEGQLVVEELRPIDDSGGQPVPPKKAKTNSVFPRPPPPKSTDGEATSALRPERSSRSQASIPPKTSASRASKAEVIPDTRPRETIVTQSHSAASMSSGATGSNATLPGGSVTRWRALLAVATLFGVLVGAVGVGYALFGRGSGGGDVANADPRKAFARVRLSSEPSGATVIVDGSAVTGVTPVELTTLTEGPHTVIVGKEGFSDYEDRITVPAEGELSVPVIRLARVVVDNNSVDSGSIAAAVEQTSLTVRTVPEGAALLIDGVDSGRTPVTVKVPRGAPVKLTVGMSGFVDIERAVRIGNSPAQVESFTLRKKDKALVVENADDRRPGGVGVVRFVVDPWAEVSCNNKKLGEVPGMGNKQLPAGLHECKFWNSDLNKTLTRTVKVEANQTQNVFVKF